MNENYRPKQQRPVVGIDIDGTLGDYHAHFLSFAAAWLGRPMPSANEINPGLRLSEFMGVSRSTYRAIKLAYRQGGLKRSMPVYPGARDLTVRIRAAGGRVFICSTRPYLRLENIDSDTRHWLTRRARVQYDGFIWGEHKYRDLVKSCGITNIVGVLEDLPLLSDQAMGLGITVYLRDQPYNRHLQDNHYNCGADDGARSSPKRVRVYNLQEAEKYLLEDLHAWKARQRGQELMW